MQEVRKNRKIIYFVLLGLGFELLTLLGMGIAWSIIGIVPLMMGLYLAIQDRSASRISTPYQNTQSRMRAELVLEELSKSISFPFLTLNQAGRITFKSEALTRQFPNLKTGDHFSQIARGSHFVDAVRAALEGQEVSPFNIELQRGAERVFEIILADMRTHPIEGLDAVLLMEIHDRTDERRSDLLRRDFIANASHELRTPLASIMGGLETIDQNQDMDTVAHFLPIMTKEAKRMERLLHDMMALSRIEMNEHYQPRNIVDLQKILEMSLASLKTRGALEHAVVDNQFLTQFQLRGDEDQLMQVLINILDNAVKYSGDQPIIKIDRVENDPAYPRKLGLRISDNGKGIDPIHIPRLTERFYRASEQDSRNKGGTGLGLAIVKHMLLRHQGELQIQSKLGEGSNFTIWLPNDN